MSAHAHYCGPKTHTVRPEIMTPLRHTMRLVNHEPGQPFPARQIPNDPLDVRPGRHHLRRDVYHLGPWFRLRQGLMRLVLVRLGHVASVCEGGDIELEEMTGLVVDQGDQRGDDEGDPARGTEGADGGKLVFLSAHG